MHFLSILKLAMPPNPPNTYHSARRNSNIHLTLKTSGEYWSDVHPNSSVGYQGLEGGKEVFTHPTQCWRQCVYFTSLSKVIILSLV